MRWRGARTTLDRTKLADVYEAVGYGVLNACHAVEGASKALTPVHGDPTQGGPFRTFAPGAKPIGGTLRRSQHSVVRVNGRLLPGSGQPEEGAMYPDRALIEGWVGTNLYYAGWVHDGTARMPARPYLMTAYLTLAPRLGGLIEAAARQRLSRRY